MGMYCPTLDPLSEIREVRIGDRRLDERAVTLASTLAAAPGLSLPAATGGGAALEAAYRFMRNPRVTLAKLLEPHIDATVARCLDAPSVIVAHDTSEFRYGGEAVRDGLGEVACQGQGFFGHFALAITEERHALGVLGVAVVVRERNQRRNTRKIDYAKRAPNRESARWRELFEEVQTRIGAALPIHVMDREADEFTLLADMVEMSCRFVVRLSHGRRRRTAPAERDVTERPLVADAVRALEGVAEREVLLAARTQRGRTGSRRDHPDRDRRMARLRFAAGTMSVDSPSHLQPRRAPLTLNLVHVIEIDAPTGEQPIEWLLYTNEPIATATDVLAVVDAYRSRWVIEEFFKALKTGCAIERRQLESKDALLNCLGLMAPIAAKMLSLRSLARVDPSAPATNVLSPVELDALRDVATASLPSVPTARQALFAIAALAGHLKGNGPPGWQILARGFETLGIAVRLRARRREK